MRQPLEQQLQAFNEARQLIGVPRANEILAWKNWQHGGVLGGAPPPEYSEMTDEENEAIKGLWLTLDGSASWMTALYMLRNDHRPK